MATGRTDNRTYGAFKASVRNASMRVICSGQDPANANEGSDTTHPQLLTAHGPLQQDSSQQISAAIGKPQLFPRKYLKTDKAAAMPG